MSATEPSTDRRRECMPVIFAAHGARILLDDGLWKAGSAAFPQPLENPPGFPQAHSNDDGLFGLDFFIEAPIHHPTTRSAAKMLSISRS